MHDDKYMCVHISQSVSQSVCVVRLSMSVLHNCTYSVNVSDWGEFVCTCRCMCTSFMTCRMSGAVFLAAWWKYMQYLAFKQGVHVPCNVHVYILIPVGIF